MSYHRQAPIEPTGEILSDRTKWRQYKRASIRLSRAYEALGLRKSTRVANCGSYLRFRECPADNRHHKSLSYADFCRDRLCPTCRSRRSMALARQVQTVAHTALQQRKLQFVLLTLTVENCAGDELSATIDLMLEAFSRMTRWRQFKTSIKGFYRSLEVNYNEKDCTYHPHLHVLLAVSTSYFNTSKQLYINQREWRLMWRQALDADYLPRVDTHKVQTKSIGSVVRYSSKPDLFDHVGNNDEYTRVIGTLDLALKGRHLTGFGGVLKQVARELQSQRVHDDDAVNCRCAACGSDLVDHMFRWAWAANNYVG